MRARPSGSTSHEHFHDRVRGVRDARAAVPEPRVTLLSGAVHVEDNSGERESEDKPDE